MERGRRNAGEGGGCAGGDGKEQRSGCSKTPSERAGQGAAHRALGRFPARSWAQPCSSCKGIPSATHCWRKDAEAELSLYARLTAASPPTLPSRAAAFSPRSVLGAQPSARTNASHPAAVRTAPASAKQPCKGAVLLHAQQGQAKQIRRRKHCSLCFPQPSPYGFPHFKKEL